MSRIVTANVEFVDQDGKTISYPTQSEFFRIRLSLENQTDEEIKHMYIQNAFIGNSIGAGLKHGISFPLDTRNLGLAGNGKKEFISYESRTYYKDLCILEIEFSREADVQVILTSSIEKNAIQLQKNKILMQFYVICRSEKPNTRVARTNIFLGAASLVVALVSLIIAFRA